MSDSRHEVPRTGTITPESYKQGDASEVPVLEAKELVHDLASVQPAGTTVEPAEARPQVAKRGARFWLIFLALSFALFLSPLELTSVSTALPTILLDLNNGEDFIWISSAYTLASTAILPLSGALAEIFGRRPSMLLALVLFALGSALCGSAQTVPWLIGGRTVQGMGGGCILSITNIVISDLVPLKERGFVSGVLGLVWALAAALGPLIGGAVSSHGQWRWLFYLNLPVCGLAFILVLTLLNLKNPPGTFLEKLAKIDWIGNFLIIASSSSCIIALTWGGVVYPWSSARVLVPLLVGLGGMGLFLLYEARIARHPMVPFIILSNRTSFSGYLQTFINPIVMLSVIYYLPTYFQACKGASPLISGVDTFGLSMVLGPIVILTGVSVTKWSRYRTQSYVGWAFLILAMGLLSMVSADTPLARTIGFSVLVSVGGGIVYAITYFPVLAPLPVDKNAHALAFFAFCRSFAGVWGVTISGTILQNELNKRLPVAFLNMYPGGASIAYSAIPDISGLQEPLRSQVRDAFAGSIAVIWQVMIGIAGAGLLSSLAMKNVQMGSKVDEKWGLEKGEKSSPTSKA
ncbi:major facilitator superfamily domain-containing protein [Dichomitus squalens]|uniref:Major facilitator superfamily domain-containing protein n=1 Tax=Dichomitus squalens TaxID=114155 RepID=A0A4Q9NCW4_9APHY|nr:major facilitator superfamily domain-containing protein [Dichomitus squalens]TBU38799.1 major facilitator superfamily domain-containing protein [Dichomitus squalens]TBU60669.1 major facilitator superfamily domain-containing protein [Dichomitus squalens]